jgi:flagellar protein FliS
MSVAMKHYKAVGARCAVENASPHRLIEILFTAVLARLSEAKGAVRYGDIAGKGLALGKAASIVSALRGAVIEDGESLSSNLDALYEYLERRILDANLRNDQGIIEECVDLLTPIAQAWREISPDRVKKVQEA